MKAPYTWTLIAVLFGLIVVVVGFGLASAQDANRECQARVNRATRQARYVQVHQEPVKVPPAVPLTEIDYAYGDGIHQGCEWCGARCDGFERGWHAAEKGSR
jgi:hypothetical protein